MLVSQLLSNKSKKFPNFITGNPAICQQKNIDKVFPKIGLSNFKEPIDIKFDFKNIQLDKVVHLAIKQWLAKWNDEGRALHNIRGLELVKMSQVLYLFEELNRRFNKKDGVALTEDNTVLVTKPILSFNEKALVKGGADCTHLVKTLLNYGANYAQVTVMSVPDMQAQCKDMSIVFRSDTLEGYWDLITMSMRGIKSCMRWEARQHQALVGTLMDPCCGIIYLTNGAKTAFGSQMLFRSIVRLVVNKTDKPLLVVDRVYSTFYQNKPGEMGTFDRQIKNVFIECLQKKIPHIEIVDAEKTTWNTTEYVIPRFDGYDHLHEGEMSYRDTHIPYGNSNNHLNEYLPKLMKISFSKKKPVTLKTTTKRSNKKTELYK